MHAIEQEKRLQANGQQLTENQQQLSALQGQLRQYKALAAEVAHLKVLMGK